MGLMLCGFFATAQKGNFEIGLTGGLNIASVSSPMDYYPDLGTDDRTAANLGLSVAYYLTDHWSIKTKLLYDQKGEKGQITFYEIDPAMGIPFAQTNSNFELDYLTLPLTVNWQFGKKVILSFGAGGYYGLLIKSNEAEQMQNYSTFYGYEKSDYGAVGNFGIKVPVYKSLKIGLEYEFQQGYQEILERNRSSAPDHHNSRHGISIGAYYTL